MSQNMVDFNLFACMASKLERREYDQVFDSKHFK